MELHSTRLFPKNLGADKYLITGIASRCDWVVTSDHQLPHTALKRNTKHQEPLTVFLSLRSPFNAIRYFVNSVLPEIKSPFILVSGSEDATVPNQIDLRWRRFNDYERSLIKEIYEHPMLIHWFAENLDSREYCKISPLPLGMVDANAALWRDVAGSKCAPQFGRFRTSVLCAHIVREGPQWEPRKKVTKLAKTVWSNFCTVLDKEVPEAEFQRLLTVHDFVLCVEGGGLDPSPKAWHAILSGCVPIIRSSPLSSAYEHLPVMVVDDWSEKALNEEMLADELVKLAPHYLDPLKRRIAIERLGIDYWWDYIKKPYEDTFR